MVRLLGRADGGSGDADLYTGLVQACRYCGLLEAAVTADSLARSLDPDVQTSVPHAYLALGDYDMVRKTNRDDPPVLNPLALELQGRRPEAILELRALEDTVSFKLACYFITATRAALEGKDDECQAATTDVLDSWYIRDPCSRYYLARHLAFIGDRDRALPTLKQAVEGGFFCAPLLEHDPWLDALRDSPELASIMQYAETRHRAAAALFDESGGRAILKMN